MINKKHFEMTKIWVERNCWFHLGTQGFMGWSRTYPNIQNLVIPCNYISVFKKLQPILDKTITRIKVDDLSYGNLKSLPKSLVFLNIRVCRYQAVPFDLPNLKYLALGRHFDHSLDMLPPNLEELVLHPGSRFNSSIDRLPMTLLRLRLNNNFNQPVNNLPENLSELYLGANFNQSIGKLPPKLTKLWILYLPPIYRLHSSVEGEFRQGRFNQEMFYLPHSLVELKVYSSMFDGSLEAIPHEIQILHLIVDTLLDIESLSYTTLSLPPKLNELKISHLDDRIARMLPGGILNLYTERFSVLHTKLTLPLLQILSISTDMRFKFPSLLCELPPHIRELTILGGFNHKLCCLPHGLLRLTLGERFNHSVRNLPRNVKYLKLGKGFKKTIASLPSSLVELHTHPEYTHKSLENFLWDEELYYIN